MGVATNNIDRVLDTLTRSRITALLAEAAEAGDMLAVRVCEDALTGNASARRTVARMLADAEAQS